MRNKILLLLVILPCISLGRELPQNRRGMWVVRDALKSKTQIDNVINTAERLEITDLFIQVRALGQTYYDSGYESRAQSSDQSYDPLAYIIERSKNTSIRIHAWVNMFYIWSGNDPPAGLNHIFNKRSAYLLRRDTFPDYKTLRDQGYTGYFVDPKVAEIQTDLLNILNELAENYQIAGIHLDYFRYPGIEYSFTPASRTRYMLDEIYDPWLIYESPQAFSKRYGYEVFLNGDRAYRASLVETLNQYLKNISDSIKSIKPDIELSVAVKPDPVTAKHRYFQDWITWLNNNLCDFAVIMNYRTDWNEFTGILREIENRQLQTRVMVGISTYNQPPQAVLYRMQTVMASRFAGFSLFSYNHISSNRIYFQKIFTAEFAGG
ncbi:MAG: hypothetical protein E4H13_00625 [Calditrichales bacterium]|nr:MAG: hypothetical protein E4H13_00625 [Calditrichales bacterium]